VTVNSSVSNKTALVLFSGGQDSTISLAWALDRFDRVETIGFDYGQRHNVELECRSPILNELKMMNVEWAKRLGEDHVLDISVFGQIGGTAMTDNVSIIMDKSGLPNTFVPGRNLIFFNFAGALAYRRGIKHLVGGMCETDYSGYPDCRDETLKAFQLALNLGTDSDFIIETPLMWINKTQSWELADKIGGAVLIDLVITHTHTCYLGERNKLNDWGYGCGVCPACDLRRTGYLNWCGLKKH
jgi:7-cyano-7-deazaguanine synthase